MNEQLPRLLVVDDDPTWLEQVPLILEDECTVDGYPTLAQGIAAVQSTSYDLILLDLNFDNDARSGLDFFRQIQGVDRGANVIMISGETNPARLIEAFNAGVSRFIPKPSSADQIRQAVRQVLEQREIRRRAQAAALRPSDLGPNPLLGKSPAMRRLQDEVGQILIAGVSDVLIQGETGTGKELLARLIAGKLDRSQRFIPIHCGAINDGLIESELFGHARGAFTGAERDRIGAFEAAGGGFVFLDEIGEMPIGQQPKLLRVLQERKVTRVGEHAERPVSFKTVSATHVDLVTAVAAGRFREDLYYRIAKSRVVIPALRERLDDIPLLAEVFLSEGGGVRKEFTPEALALLGTYEWPGNVRQLKATIEALKLRNDEPVIREKDVCALLPEVAGKVRSSIDSPNGTYGRILMAGEKKKFQGALIQAKGDRDVAAKLLGLSRATYFRRAKELGLVSERRSPVR
jgi:DNA-binding NtrC family response regulator